MVISQTQVHFIEFKEKLILKMMYITISSILLYLCGYAAVATESPPRSKAEGTYKDYDISTIKSENTSRMIPNEERNSIDEQDPCYNLIDVFSPMVNFYELFLDFKPNVDNENPRHGQSDFPFNFTDISISIGKIKEISFVHHDAEDVHIWMPLKDSITLKGRVTYSENGNPRQTYSTSFNLVYHNYFLRVALLQNDTIKFNLISKDNEMQINIQAIQGEESPETLGSIDSTLRNEIMKYSEDFKIWVCSTFEKRLTKNLAGNSSLKNNIKMLKISLNKTVCLHERKLYWKPKEGSIDFIFLEMKRFRKISFITLQENADHTNTNNIVCNDTDANRMYDCQTFQKFHKFDLSIDGLESTIHLSYHQNAKQRSDANLTVVVKARFFGKTATTAIKIKNVNFRLETCQPDPKACSLLAKEIQMNLLDFSLFFKDLFTPLKRTDDHTLVAKWLADG